MPLTHDQQRYLDTVRQIVLDGLDGHDAGVWLIGSFARGNPDRASDIDVAVEPRGAVPASLLAHIEERLADSTVPYFVELVNLGDTDARFREAAKREGVPWRS
jgi:predicted nucleotidyltransferase